MLPQLWDNAVNPPPNRLSEHPQLLGAGYDVGVGGTPGEGLDVICTRLFTIGPAFKRIGLDATGCVGRSDVRMKVSVTNHSR
jgi:hypothetical protein